MSKCVFVEKRRTHLHILIPVEAISRKQKKAISWLDKVDLFTLTEQKVDDFGKLPIGFSYAKC